MENIENISEIIQKNSPDGGFLQSQEWKKFQQSVGRKTHAIKKSGFYCTIIEHVLPIVGKYFYCPRGPIVEVESEKLKVKNFINELINLAKKENAGWIRIEPKSEDILDLIKKNTCHKLVKAPHDIQPKEIFVVDISKDQQELLSEMKQKTRYNIGVAQKKGVLVETGKGRDDIEIFLQLTKEMAIRQGISSHPENYYRKMIEQLPENMLRLYFAKYEEKIIAVNLILFFGKFVTYLHGASSNQNRNVMAPYLLHWQTILDAKEQGYGLYDFGGVKINDKNGRNNWAGITSFKFGFSPNTKSVIYPGTYDIIIDKQRYWMYRGLQKVKTFLKN